MLEQKRTYGFMRIFLGFVLIVLIVAGGVMLYQAGMAQGAASAADGELLFHDYSRLPRGIAYPMRGYFFFPGGFFFGLLFLFLIFGVIRRVFFASRWGMHRMHGSKWQDKAEEWHIALHNRMEGQSEKAGEAPPDQTEED